MIDMKKIEHFCQMDLSPFQEQLGDAFKVITTAFTMRIEKAIWENDAASLEEGIFVAKELLLVAATFSLKPSTFSTCDPPFFKEEELQKPPSKHPSKKKIKQKEKLKAFDIGIQDIPFNAKPLSFSYNGVAHQVATWRQFAKVFLLLLFEEDPEKMEECIYEESLNGTMTPYFSFRPDHMGTPLHFLDKEHSFYVDIEKLLLNNKRILKVLLQKWAIKEDQLRFSIQYVVKEKTAS